MTLRGRARGFCAAAALLSTLFAPSIGACADEAAVSATSPEAPILKRADFSSEKPSHEARGIADWVVSSRDNRGMPFIIVDKPHAKVFVFDAYGHLLGAAPALLGLTVGDRMVPPITGDRETSNVPLRDKITPAGRFWAQLGRSVREEVLWVDYDTGLSLHPVLTTNPEERRLERLKTPTIADNRISAGCINVPKQFYENVVHPAFQGLVGAVYILPDSGSVREIFHSSYDVDEQAALRKMSASEPPEEAKQ